ncbi:MAG: hypothetical protein AAGI71_05920 [Bacteroidota bacterium]
MRFFIGLCLLLLAYPVQGQDLRLRGGPGVVTAPRVQTRSYPVGANVGIGGSLRLLEGVELGVDAAYGRYGFSEEDFLSFRFGRLPGQDINADGGVLRLFSVDVSVRYLLTAAGTDGRITNPTGLTIYPVLGVSYNYFSTDEIVVTVTSQDEPVTAQVDQVESWNPGFHFGAGVRYGATPNIGLFAEGLYRIVATDGARTNFLPVSVGFIFSR